MQRPAPPEIPADAELETPMAIVILCGLLTSTALNRFVVPALYLRFGSRVPERAALITHRSIQ